MGDKPRNIKEDIIGGEAPHWKQSMEEEMKALNQIQTYHL